MAEIIVKLYGGLIPSGTSPAGAGEIRLEFPSGESVRGVLQRLGILETKVHLAFVGKQRVTMEHLLKDGDILNLFPAMAGG
jgi:molybdopterin converting factor small subunit